MASYWFNEGAEEMDKGTVVWGTGSYFARLVEGALSARTLTNLSTVTKVGTDQAVGTLSIVKDDTNNQIKFVSGATVTWAAVAAGSTITHIVVYKDGGSDAAHVPLFLHDIADKATNDGDLVLTWPTVNGTTNVVGYSTQS